MSAQLGRAYGLPKFIRLLPTFQIFDTTNVSNYKIGQCLLSMLQPPTINNYTLKDSSDATNKVKSVQSDILEVADQFVSFGIESPFSNEPSILF